MKLPRTFLSFIETSSPKCLTIILLSHTYLFHFAIGSAGEQNSMVANDVYSNRTQKCVRISYSGYAYSRQSTTDVNMMTVILRDSCELK